MKIILGLKNKKNMERDIRRSRPLSWNCNNTKAIVYVHGTYMLSLYDGAYYIIVSLQNNVVRFYSQQAIKVKTTI